MELIFLSDLLPVLASAGNGDRDGFWLLWPLVPLFWIAVLALVLRVVVFCGRRFQPSPMDRALGILAERYARGEIDADEYRRRNEELR